MNDVGARVQRKKSILRIGDREVGFVLQSRVERYLSLKRLGECRIFRERTIVSAVSARIC